jgi:nitrogenase molybdenum-iron protein alpha chain
MAIKTKRMLSKTKSCSCSMPGVWRAAAYCSGAAVIFHSPRACAHVARSMDISAQYRALANGAAENLKSIPVVSSMLQEKHSIFGGADRLRACIEDVVNTYRPKCLIIANSCVAGVIGDDVEAVGKESEVKYGIPVLTVPCYGFLDGEYYQGYFAVAEIKRRERQ